MKRAVALLVLLLCTGALAQFGTLPKIAVYVTGDLGESEKRALGTEMLNALVRSGRFTAVERSTAFVAEIEKEQVTQRSGAIDDSQISRLGKQFGIQYVCIADVAAAFGSHQVSARILDVETAEIGLFGKASGQLNSMKALESLSASVTSAMLGTPQTNEHTQQNYAPQAGQQSHLDFTSGQRWGTWAVNWLIPGLGSATIMKDKKGMWIQIGLFAGGYIMIMGGADSGDGELVLVGAGCLVGNIIYNIVRSSTYKKPAHMAATESPQRLNLAVFPDKNGNLKAYALYNMEF